MSIVKKLRFTENYTYILQQPESTNSLFDELTYKTSMSTKGEIQQLLLFAKAQSVLKKYIPKIVSRLADDAMFWIAYPKKSGNIRSDITRDSGWDVLNAFGFDPVMQIAVDENWSALRFRKTEKIGPKLRDIPMSERKVEGIDFVNRKITLPKDVAQALKMYKEALALFKSYSFTHQKEHIEAIVTAKKPETRVRRIGKMIEMLETSLDSKKK